MGMFSWCCKGCGHELKEGEYVRMNGCKGEYDGYGGNTGGFDFESSSEEPACWHEACYQKATPKQKLDETSSPSAPEQGFGYPALAFQRGYVPDAPTKFIAFFDVSYYDKQDESKYQGFKYYLVKTENGYELQDQEEYDRKYEKQAEERWDTMDWDAWEKTWEAASEEERMEISRRREEELDIAIGMKSPQDNAAEFATFGEAKAVAEVLMEKINQRSYIDLVIQGIQENARGMYYERIREPEYKRVKGEVYKLEPTGRFIDEVEYIHGESAKREKGHDV